MSTFLWMTRMSSTSPSLSWVSSSWECVGISGFGWKSFHPKHSAKPSRILRDTESIWHLDTASASALNLNLNLSLALALMAATTWWGAILWQKRWHSCWKHRSLHFWTRMYKPWDGSEGKSVYLCFYPCLDFTSSTIPSIVSFWTKHSVQLPWIGASWSEECPVIGMRKNITLPIRVHCSINCYRKEKGRF